MQGVHGTSPCSLDRILNGLLAPPIVVLVMFVSNNREVVGTTA
jgi:hypothetical protein